MRPLAFKAGTYASKWADIKERSSASSSFCMGKFQFSETLKMLIPIVQRQIEEATDLCDERKDAQKFPFWSVFFENWREDSPEKWRKIIMQIRVLSGMDSICSPVGNLGA